MATTIRTSRSYWIWSAAGVLVVATVYLNGITFWSVWSARSEVPWRDQWSYFDDAKAIRAEDQELLLRSYSRSCFSCLPEIHQGYREGQLVLRKILRSRCSFTIAVFAAASHPCCKGIAVASSLPTV